jgi:hypothetical protein
LLNLAQQILLKYFFQKESIEEEYKAPEALSGKRNNRQQT